MKHLEGHQIPEDLDDCLEELDKEDQFDDDFDDLTPAPPKASKEKSL